jgi:hypothetical protein
MNILGVNNGRQTEIHRAEPLVPEPLGFIWLKKKLKTRISPGTNQIPIELIKAGGRLSLSEIYELIISISNKGALPRVWKESIIVPIYQNGDNTDCSNYKGHITLANNIQNFSQHAALKITSIYSGN